jgi:hypothetical protein
MTDGLNPGQAFGSARNVAIRAWQLLITFWPVSVIMHYLISRNFEGKKKPGEQAQKRFERLRDRIRVILALPIGKAFSRKQPFQPWPGGRPITPIDGSEESSSASHAV